ncbi:MAG: AraC family transcriptional regulator [Balneolaceae bacterium]
MTHTFRDHQLGAAFLITDQPGLVERKRAENSFRIIWNRGSAVEIEVDAIPNLVETDHILCVTPHQKINIKGRPDDLKAFYFNREFYCIHENDHEVSCEGLLFYGSSGVSIIRLNKNEKEKFHHLYGVFMDEIQTSDSIQEQMLRMLLKRLIIKCTRLAKEQYLGDQVSETGVELIRKFNVLVEQHFRRKKQVIEYAELLHKSPKTLSNLFLKFDEMTPLQVIHSRVILEAKRLMIYTDKTIKEISHDLGYEEISYFSRLFKKETGMNPTEYREAAKSN